MLLENFGFRVRIQTVTVKNNFLGYFKLIFRLFISEAEGIENQQIRIFFEIHFLKVAIMEGLDIFRPIVPNLFEDTEEIHEITLDRMGDKEERELVEKRVEEGRVGGLEDDKRGERFTDVLFEKIK